MTEETNNSDHWKHKARPYVPLAAGSLAFLSILGLTGNWWRIATYNFRNFDTSRQDKVALEEAFKPESIALRTKDIRERFATMMATTLKQYGRKEMTEDEKQLAAGILEKYELKGYTKADSGFYGTAWKNMETGKVIMVLGGSDANINTPGEFLCDLDEICWAPTGALGGQFEDALAFTKKIQKEFGPIDHIVGHSLGGQLALQLMGMKACGENTKCTTFDSTGYTDTMIASCARRSGLSEQEVRKRFQSPDLFNSITIMHNGFNCMGKQAGAHLTVSNNVNCRPFYPEKHFYADFRDAFSKDLPLIPGELKGSSSEATWFTGVTLVLATLSLGLGAYKTHGALKKQENGHVETYMAGENRQAMDGNAR